MTEKTFHTFLHAFREESLKQDGKNDDVDNRKIDETMKNNNVEAEPEAGIVNLNEEDISALDNDDMNDWFK